jgi:glycerol uptake facilitator-like aquaporin
MFVSTLVDRLGELLNDNLVKGTPLGLLLPLVGLAFIQNNAYFSAFRQEFVGTMVMIVCTFSAGKWIGETDNKVAWASHAVGVVAADYLTGGPHVNPAVTVSMFTLGKCSYTEGYVRIAAQMAGGLVSFPLYHLISTVALKLTPFGGPEFHEDNKANITVADAFLSEFCASFLLMWLIYLVNWEYHFGKRTHYIIKQTLTAIGIRGLIEFFPTAGPGRYIKERCMPPLTSRLFTQEVCFRLQQ